MMTRKDYLSAPRQTQVDSMALHRRYFVQFVTDELKGALTHHFGEEYLIASYHKDQYLNSIPLHEWDSIVHHLKHLVDLEILQNTGEGWSVSAAVCIFKEAVRQVVENQIH